MVCSTVFAVRSVAFQCPGAQKFFNPIRTRHARTHGHDEGWAENQIGPPVLRSHGTWYQADTLAQENACDVAYNTAKWDG
jgi:hypothetical protein